jgi:dienelactone hydrolase
MCFGLSGLLLSGCSHKALRSTAGNVRTLPPAIAAEFSHVRQANPTAKVNVLEEREGYTIRRVELLAAPSGADTNRWIELDYYDVKGSAPTPVIMVLPMLGGGYTLEKHFANYFASKGYAAVIVRRDRRQKTMRIEDLNRLLKEMVLDHKRVIDWLELRETLDCSRLGIFGVSMGGIKGAILLPLEDRIKAAALGLCAGDLPYILTHTTEPGLTKRREQELKDRGITLEESEKRLREMITCDPLTYAGYVDPKKVLLVLGRYDDVVPYEKGVELKEKMGNPETILLPAGHYTAVLSIPYIKSQSFEFFEKRFAESSGRLADKRGGNLSKIQAGRR